METCLTVKNLQHHSWALMVQEQSNSGLSIRDWCSQNNISTKTFYYRRKQIRSELLQAASPVFAELVPPEGRQHILIRWIQASADDQHQRCSHRYRSGNTAASPCISA